MNIYLDNIVVQVPYANASGMIGVYDTEGTDHTPADYDDIDNKTYCSTSWYHVCKLDARLQYVTTSLWNE